VTGCEAEQIGGVDICDRAFINISLWNQLFAHEIAQPLGAVRINFIVVDAQAASLAGSTDPPSGAGSASGGTFARTRAAFDHAALSTRM